MSLFLQHLSYGNGSLHVDAAFQQTLWSVAPICSGSEVAQGTVTLFVFSFFAHLPDVLQCLTLKFPLAVSDFWTNLRFDLNTRTNCIHHVHTHNAIQKKELI